MLRHCSKHCLSVVLIAFLLSATGVAADERPSVKLPAKEKLHIYLLMGQSNMAGRGKPTDADRKPHPRVLKLDKSNNWVPATAPLHFDKPKIAGVGPGDAFGRVMAEADKTATIGLVPCAFGGTPLRRWVKGGDLYANAVKRARIAMKTGTLKGVIWHQGESDSRNESTAKSYAKRLAGMITDLRKDLESPGLPFVVGEIGRFLSEKRLPHFRTVNREINAIPKTVPRTAVAKSEGLKAKSDGVHFNTAALRILGKRYATAMRTLQKEPAKP